MNNPMIDDYQQEENQGPAPAPLDLGRLEVEAKTAAAKHVASLLQRPEQLEKVDQYKRRAARKKASVEAMLKTAVQSQLDGVKTGLNQMQGALQDVYEIKQSLDEVEETYNKIKPLHKTLGELKKENNKFCQLAAAQENLKHIFTVPESVSKTREFINEGKLLQAHKHLIDLENSRDELLQELHRQPNPSPTDLNTLSKYFAEVEKLSVELSKQLWIIIQRTLMSVRREPTLLVTALRIIEREERMDTAWERRKEQTGFMPPGRPKGWRNKCFEVLKTSVATKIEGNQPETRESDKMWLVKHLEITRQLMLEDLKVIKLMLQPVFPPEYDIVKRYTRMYHEALSAHLLDVIDQDLIKNEIGTLLKWVKNYAGPELLRHPEVNIDIAELGPLLSPKVMEGQQNKFLKCVKDECAEYFKNTLKVYGKDWLAGELPICDGDGYYSSLLPGTIIEIVEQNMALGEWLDADLANKLMQVFLDELGRFENDFRNEVTIFRDRHTPNRGEPRGFLENMIANANNGLVFADYIRGQRKKYLGDEFENEDEDGIRKDRYQILHERFLGTTKLCCDIILDEIFTGLKDSNCLNELLTRAWMGNQGPIGTIVLTWQDYSHDLVKLKPQAFTTLIEEGRLRMIKEYLRALLARKLSCKTYEERRVSCEQICQEGDKLKQVFTEIAPQQSHAEFDVLKDVVEVIKLRDPSMLSLEIPSLVKKYPDIRIEQLNNLILCRDDVQKGEARQLALDALEADQSRPKTKGIFSSLLA